MVAICDTVSHWPMSVPLSLSCIGSSKGVLRVTKSEAVPMSQIRMPQIGTYQYVLHPADLEKTGEKAQ